MGRIGETIETEKLSGLALDRYSKRHDGLPAESGIAELMDDWFPDPYMERVYPNIKFR